MQHTGRPASKLADDHHVSSPIVVQACLRMLAEQALAWQYENARPLMIAVISRPRMHRARRRHEHCTSCTCRPVRCSADGGLSHSWKVLRQRERLRVRHQRLCFHQKFLPAALNGHHQREPPISCHAGPICLTISGPKHTPNCAISVFPKQHLSVAVKAGS